MGRGHPYGHGTGPCWTELPVPPLGSSVCYWLLGTVFAPRDTVLSTNRSAPRVALRSFGTGSRELPSWHQELRSLGPAHVGAVPLRPCELGLSHLVGIYSVSEITKAELSTWKERRQAEGCSACLAVFFPAVSRKTLGNTENKHLWKVDIYLSLSTESHTQNNFKIKLFQLHTPRHNQVQGQWQGPGVTNP